MYDTNIKNQAIKLYKENYSSNDIAELLNTSQRSVQRWIKLYNDTKKYNDNKNIKTKKNNSNLKEPKYLWQLPDKFKPEKRIIGVFSDVHAPFTKLEYLDWLIKTFEENGVTDVVCGGDIVDFHCVSKHPTEPDARGVIDEFDDAYNVVQEYINAFPYLYYCIGNHDNRIERMGAEVGLPNKFLKSFKEIFDIPDTWNINTTHNINGVLYTHGTEFSSHNSLSTLNSTTHISTVIGHQHSLFGVIYNNNGYCNKMFAMCTGCLIDNDAYAFRYGKNSKFKPVLGCGIVKSDNEAYVIPYNEN